MENFLMNSLAVAAIIAMLYSLLAKWRNIDKELDKKEAGSKMSACGKLQARNKIVSGSAIVSGSEIVSGSTIAVCRKIDSGKRVVASSARKLAAQPIPA